MEDAEARDLRVVCEFILRLRGGDLRRASDTSALFNVRDAARKLLTSIAVEPSRPEPCEAPSAPKPVVIVHGSGWPEDRHQGLSDPMG